MASTTAFIDKTAFPPYKVISTYIIAADIDPYILEAQKAFLEPILTKTIYENLQTAVAASTETAADLALIVQLTPLLVYKSFEVFLGYANVKPTELGLRTMNEQFSEVATPAQMAALRKQTDTMSLTYENDLRNFLYTNRVAYVWNCDYATKQRFGPPLSIVKKTQVNRR